METDLEKLLDLLSRERLLLRNNTLLNLAELSVDLWLWFDDDWEGQSIIFLEEPSQLKDMSGSTCL
jgi:hypothetical protein